MADPSTRSGTGMAVSVGLVTLAALAQWIISVVITKGLGSGVLPATAVLTIGGLVAVPCALFLLLGWAVAGDIWRAARIAGFATGALLLNLGLICADEATAMQNASFDYSLVDRHPEPTGWGVATAGALLILAAAMNFWQKAPARA